MPELRFIFSVSHRINTARTKNVQLHEQASHTHRLHYANQFLQCVCAVPSSVLGPLNSRRKQRRRDNGNKPDFGCIKSGLPQGSVLYPLLVIIYIGYLDTGIISDVSMFVDDTKICRVIESDQDARVTRLYGWAEKLHIEFNAWKCNAISLDRNNFLYNDCLNDTPVVGLGVRGM